MVSKRFCLVSVGLVAMVVGSVLFVPACGGSSEEGTAGAGGSTGGSGGSGGSGGVLMESGPPESGTEDVVADDTPTSEAAVPDQSVPDSPVADVIVLEGSLFDMSVPDVSLGDGGATLPACYDCTTQACGSELTACEKDDKCRTLMLCFFNEACLDPAGPNGIDMGCALGCLSAAGISDIADPSATLGMAVANCVGTACADKCGMSDAGPVQPDVVQPDVVQDVIQPPDVASEAVPDVMQPDASGD